MAAAVPYDEMKEEETEPVDSPEEEKAEDPSKDDEFMMAAEEAGFTGEKASAFWRAIERCVELTGKGGSMMSLGGDEET